MPVYEFMDDDGEVVVLEMMISELQSRLTDGKIELDDGRTATYDWGQFSRPQNHRSVSSCPGNWPMVSYSMGVHPDQISDQMQADKKHGVPTDYTTSGDPIYTGRGHRKRHMKAYKIFDRSGGYSDASPENC